MSVSVGGGGLSVGGGGIDLNALVKAGPDFGKHILDLQLAAAKHADALANLNLGKSALDAHEEAQRILANAKAKIEADVARTTQWVKETTDQTNTLLAVAQAKHAEADKKLNDAMNVHALASDAMNKAQANAKSVTDSANAKGQRIILDAQAQAASLKSQVEDQQKRLQQAIAEAEDAKAKHQAAKAKYDKKLARLQSAATEE